MTNPRGNKSRAVLDASLEPALTSRANRRILRSLPSAQTLLRRPRTRISSSSSSSGSSSGSRGVSDSSSSTAPSHSPVSGEPKHEQLGRAEGSGREAEAERAELDPVDFSSNDYLSLASSPDLRTRFIDRLHASPNILGARGSRLLDGGTLEHALLEERLSAFFDVPAALLYTSGYDANVGFFSCVPRAQDIVLHDELIHASVHDGLRASRVSKASTAAFAHNDVRALGRILARLVGEREDVRGGTSNVFIAVESLYSMDGDVAPLAAICETVERLLPNHNGHIVVDEAHATGVYGPHGRGLVAHFGLEDRIAARLHTFGKALAGSGGEHGRSSTSANLMTIFGTPQLCSSSVRRSDLFCSITRDLKYSPRR
jgi:7-keto-8-aminopelargonate synthetase-like enzyme